MSLKLTESALAQLEEYVRQGLDYKHPDIQELFKECETTSRVKSVKPVKNECNIAFDNDVQLETLPLYQIVRPVHASVVMKRKVELHHLKLMFYAKACAQCGIENEYTRVIQGDLSQVLDQPDLFILAMPQLSSFDLSLSLLGETSIFTYCLINQKSEQVYDLLLAAVKHIPQHVVYFMTLLPDIPYDQLQKLLDAIKNANIDKYIKLYALHKRPFKIQKQFVDWLLEPTDLNKQIAVDCILLTKDIYVQALVREEWDWIQGVQKLFEVWLMPLQEKAIPEDQSIINLEIGGFHATKEENKKELVQQKQTETTTHILEMLKLSPAVNIKLTDTLLDLLRDKTQSVANQYMLVQILSKLHKEAELYQIALASKSELSFMIATVLHATTETLVIKPADTYEMILQLLIGGLDFKQQFHPGDALMFHDEHLIAESSKSAYNLATKQSVLIHADDLVYRPKLQLKCQVDVQWTDDYTVNCLLADYCCRTNTEVDAQLIFKYLPQNPRYNHAEPGQFLSFEEIFSHEVKEFKYKQQLQNDRVLEDRLCKILLQQELSQSQKHKDKGLNFDTSQRLAQINVYCQRQYLRKLKTGHCNQIYKKFTGEILQGFIGFPSLKGSAELVLFTMQLCFKMGYWNAEKCEFQSLCGTESQNLSGTASLILDMIQQQQMDQTRLKYFDLLDKIVQDALLKYKLQPNQEYAVSVLKDKFSNMFKAIYYKNFIKQFGLRAMLIEYALGNNSDRTYKLKKLFNCLNDPLNIGYDLNFTQSTSESFIEEKYQVSCTGHAVLKIQHCDSITYKLVEGVYEGCNDTVHQLETPYLLWFNQGQLKKVFVGQKFERSKLYSFKSDEVFTFLCTEKGLYMAQNQMLSLISHLLIKHIEQHGKKFIFYDHHNTPYEVDNLQPNHFIDEDQIVVEFGITELSDDTIVGVTDRDTKLFINRKMTYNDWQTEGCLIKTPTEDFIISEPGKCDFYVSKDVCLIKLVKAMDIQPDAITYSDRYVWTINDQLHIDDTVVPLPQIKVNQIYILDDQELLQTDDQLWAVYDYHVDLVVTHKFKQICVDGRKCMLLDFEGEIWQYPILKKLNYMQMAKARAVRIWYKDDVLLIEYTQSLNGQVKEHKFMMIPPIAELRSDLNERVFNESGQQGWYRYSEHFELPAPNDIVFWVQSNSNKIQIKTGQPLQKLEDYSEIIKIVDERLKAFNCYFKNQRLDTFITFENLTETQVVQAKVVLAANQFIIDNKELTLALSKANKLPQSYQHFIQLFACPVILDSVRVYWIDGTKGKIHPRPVVRINRFQGQNLLRQLYEQTKKNSKRMLDNKADEMFCKVKLMGERSYDAGGPFKELLEKVCEEILEQWFDKTTNAIYFDQDGYQPKYQQLTKYDLEMLNFVGRLIGWSLKTVQFSLSMDLSPLFWCKLLNQPFGLNELKDTDMYRYQYLQQVLAGEWDQETCADLGSGQEVELCENGTQLSPQQFVDLYLLKYSQQFDSFYNQLIQGVKLICPQPILEHMTPSFAKQTALGSQQITAEQLIQRLECDSPHIVTFEMFKLLVTELGNKERQLLLKFITGTSRLTGDLTIVVMPIENPNSVHLTELDQCLPIAHTCSETIDIPIYSSLAVMLKQVRIAIQSCGEIDQDDNMNQSGDEDSDSYESVLSQGQLTDSYYQSVGSHSHNHSVVTDDDGWQELD